jgi:pyruvate carboxylase
MPGGQLTNLIHQARALGVEGGFETIAARYIEADELLGRLIKVTPTSKVVGDLAIFLAINDVDAAELAADPGRFALPESVLQLLAGDLGVPAGGWPEPFRTRALEAHRVVLEEPVLDDAARDVLSHPGDAARELLDTLLLPGPAREFRAVRERFGDLSVLPTEVFLFGLASDRTVAFELEPGVELRVSLEAIGEVDETGHRALYLRVNGLPRAVSVLDRTAGVVVEQREVID